MATHSSGNHALSLSYAGGRRGIPVHVVMPHTAPRGEEGRGARLRRPDHRVRAVDLLARGGVRGVQERTGADFVHPYNDPRIIAGQGTCAKEMLAQIEGLDAVIAPIGGGGMVSGTCLTLSRSRRTSRSTPPSRSRRRRLPLLQVRHA